MPLANPANYTGMRLQHHTALSLGWELHWDRAHVISGLTISLLVVT
jgi:hypothetical protein